MSLDIAGNVCPETKSNHEFRELRSVTTLKLNSAAGCPLCSLIYHGLERFHGSWLRERADSIEFDRFQSYFHTLSIDIFVPQAIAGNSDRIRAEFVYEELTSR